MKCYSTRMKSSIRRRFDANSQCKTIRKEIKLAVLNITISQSFLKCMYSFFDFSCHLKSNCLNNRLNGIFKPIS